MYFRCDGVSRITANGTLRCDNWVSVSEEELLTAVPIQQLFELLNEAFITPEPQQLVVAFSAAFMTPMFLYLIAWSLSKLVNFIK
jgi:hypothetical protein